MPRSLSSSSLIALTLIALAIVLLLALRDAGEVRAAGMTLLVDTTVDDGTKQQCDDGTADDCSLRGAINKSNFSGGDDTVVLQANQTYNLTTTGAAEDNNNTGDLDVAESFILEGHNATIVGDGDRVMELYAFPVVGVIHISDVTITGGNVTGEGGGGIKMNDSDASITLTNVTITLNATSTIGGGILSFGDNNLTIVNSHIDNNNSEESGGGIFVSNGTGTFAISGSTVSGNEGKFGGGMELGPDHMRIVDTDVDDNTAFYDCAGISCFVGGGVRAQGTAVLEITGGEIIGNHADHGSGGGVAGSYVSIDGTAIGNNVAGYRGGGVQIDNATIENVTVYNNTADVGGGLYVANNSPVSHAVISGNHATHHGGGAFLQVGASIDHSEVSNNDAGGTGGGLALGGGAPEIANTTISNNVANTGGGIGRSGDTFNAGLGGTQPSGGPPTGTAYISFSTIAFNSADVAPDIYNDGFPGAVKIGASIIDRESGTSCNPGAVSSSDYNIEHGTSCTLNQPHDLNADPMLDLLLDNGGGTRTHALLAGSPAIDLLPPGDCAVADDQRFTPRPFGAGCDAGAYESTSTETPVPSETPTPQGEVWGDVNCSAHPGTDDAFIVLEHIAGVTEGASVSGDGNSCPALDDDLNVDGNPQTWGDHNCDGSIDGVDALADLLFEAELPGLESPHPPCPDVGDGVLVTPN